MLQDNRVRTMTYIETIDGDSVRCWLDMLIMEVGKLTCRLAGINCRESTMEGGREARDHVAGLLVPGRAYVVSGVKSDKYAKRFDGYVWLGEGSTLNDLLVSQGWAVPWDGRRSPAPVPPWPRQPTPQLLASRTWAPE